MILLNIIEQFIKYIQYFLMLAFYLAVETLILYRYFTFYIILHNKKQTC